MCIVAYGMLLNTILPSLSIQVSGYETDNKFFWHNCATAHAVAAPSSLDTVISMHIWPQCPHPKFTLAVSSLRSNKKIVYKENLPSSKRYMKPLPSIHINFIDVCKYAKTCGCLFSSS
jgi:hypothetical protein